MKLKRIKMLIGLIGLMAISSTGFSQEIYDAEENPHSVRPVRSSDAMYKKTVWVRMDLNDKINTPFFSKGRWITKLMIDAVKSSLLRPYKNDSLTTRMASQEFLEKLKVRDVIEDDTIEEWGNDGWGNNDNEWGNSSSSQDVTISNELAPEDISLLDIKIDMIFDKSRGVWVRDIQSITMVLPADMNGAKGVEDPIASFSYKELVDNLFDQNTDAVWYNEANLAENQNLASAFDLSFYTAKITKYTDAKGRDLFDIYNDQKGDVALIKGQQAEYELVEYESNLWTN